MVSENSGKCPPQFVFEMIAAQATRVFLSRDDDADTIADEFTGSFADLYDTEALQSDLIQAIERLLVFIESVEIDDVDRLLLSYIWYTANYESLTIKRKKKALIGSPLKGRPRETARVYSTGKNFKTFTYAVGSKTAPPRPAEWEPTQEVEFETIFSRLFPEEFEKKEKEGK